MDAYEALRKQAAEKRDKIIQNARQEYRVAVRKIKALHKLVEGEHHPIIRPPRRPEDRSLEEVLIDLLPHNQPFTVGNACDLVYADPIGCKYKENTIRSAFPILAGKGIIRKVGRRKGRVLWARTETGAEPEPFGAMTICEIAEQMIREYGPMRFSEIAAHMKERGYRPDLAPIAVYETLRRAIFRAPGRFAKGKDGRWAVVESLGQSPSND